MHAALERGSSVSTKYALVDSYDAENYCCKVRVQPQNNLTNWLPICTLFTGSEFGIQVGIKAESMVKISFIDGDIDTGVIEACVFNDVERPMQVPEGEIWIKHESGSMLKFSNDGNVTLNTANDLEINVAGKADITTTGKTNITASEVDILSNVVVTGNVTVTGNLLATNVTATSQVFDASGAKSMSAMRTVFNAHTHAENGTGGGTTNPTTTGM